MSIKFTQVGVKPGVTVIKMSLSMSLVLMLKKTSKVILKKHLVRR